MNTVGCVLNRDSKNSIIETWSGHFFDLLHPEESVICIEDIAHHLAAENRYNGATRVPISVAQHSLLVADQFSEPWEKIYALLHDAHEAYCKDLPRPLKCLLPDYGKIADKIQAAIVRALLPAGLLWNVDQDYRDRLKAVDNAVCRAEAFELMKTGGKDWGWKDTPLVYINYHPMSAVRAEEHFISKWKRLWKLISS